MPVLLTQALQQSVLYLTAGCKTHCSGEFHSPSNHSDNTEVCLPRYTPSFSFVLLSALQFKQKCWVDSQQCAPFSAVSHTFPCLPNSWALALLIKAKHLTVQDCLKGLAKSFTTCLRPGGSCRGRDPYCSNTLPYCRSNSNFTNYKISPSSFSIAPRKRKEAVFSFPGQLY